MCRREPAGLRWADVDLESGRLPVRQPRVVVAEHKLAVGARYQDSGLLFTWLDGSPIHPLGGSVNKPSASGHTGEGDQDG